MDTGINNIRNFCILAHVDHGKSTLADRFLEITGTVEKRKMREQYLDMNPLEREKGITIKMQPVRMNYKFLMPNAKYSAFVIQQSELSNSEYILNLIDTPGHVDFTYEVSRALAAVEGAILLVDATQGVQAQTVANFNLARKQNLVIVPAVNKIDLPSAEIKKTKEELGLLLQFPAEDILEISAKVGIGVEALLQTVIAKVPPPDIDKEKPLRALIFDSLYDSYQGVIAYVRVVDGTVKKGDKIFFTASRSGSEVLEAGMFVPERTPKERLESGEIGYIATGIKEPEWVRVGDTITKLKIKNEKLKIHEDYIIKPLEGYKEPEPMVFASIFPENQDHYELLRDSLNKLKLNDASLFFEPEDASVAFGRGFRAGFLGMLHMEIVAERLKREYGLELIFSNPSVAFRVRMRGGGEKMVYSAVKLPDKHLVENISELWARVEIITPHKFLGTLTSLVNEHEGFITDTLTLAGDRMLVVFEAPLRQIIIDFHDELKGASQGFASMSYELLDYREADVVRLDILVAGEKVAPFSEILPRLKVYFAARAKVQKLKEVLPRELFAVAIQAESEGKIIARETLPALRKDVTGYLYGGDRTRKMKLWKKQQKGKKKLKKMGRVEIAPEVFLKMLKK